MQTSSVLEIPKRQGRSLSEHFNSDEFDCHCGCCTQTLIDTELVNKLEAMRTLIGKPIKINSGYRCAHRQEQLRQMGFETASGKSQHELGKAADIMCDGMTGAELDKIARSVGIKAVGVAHNWIHLDLRDDRERRWTYS